MTRFSKVNIKADTQVNELSAKCLEKHISTISRIINFPTDAICSIRVQDNQYIIHVTTPQLDGFIYETGTFYLGLHGISGLEVGKREIKKPNNAKSPQ